MCEDCLYYGDRPALDRRTYLMAAVGSRNRQARSVTCWLASAWMSRSPETALGAGAAETTALMTLNRRAGDRGRTVSTIRPYTGVAMTRCGEHVGVGDPGRTRNGRGSNTVVDPERSRRSGADQRGGGRRALGRGARHERSHGWSCGNIFTGVPTSIRVVQDELVLAPRSNSAG